MKFQLLHLALFVFLVVYVSSIEAGRGGGGGGGGGGGRGGGGGGGGRGNSVGGGRSGSIGGKSSGAKLSTAKKVGLIAGGGLTSYFTYRSYKAAHLKYKDQEDRERDSPDFDTDDGDVGYKVQERTGYSRSEGSGMSAWGLILLILGIIGVGAAIWCCHNIGGPIWQDRKSKRNRTLSFSHIVGKGDDIPLRETPSTATPSPK